MSKLHSGDVFTHCFGLQAVIQLRLAQHLFQENGLKAALMLVSLVGVMSEQRNPAGRSSTIFAVGDVDRQTQRAGLFKALMTSQEPLQVSSDMRKASKYSELLLPPTDAPLTGSAALTSADTRARRGAGAKRVHAKVRVDSERLLTGAEQPRQCRESGRSERWSSLSRLHRTD